MANLMPPESETPAPKIETRSVLDAALDGKDISAAEALHLLQLDKDDDLRRMKDASDEVRSRQAGDSVAYVAGTSLYLTNLDEVCPTVYSYSKKPGENGIHTATIDEIDAILEEANRQTLKQIEVSGGGFWTYLQIPGFESPSVLKTYARLLAYIRERSSKLRITGFSPDEIEFLCVISDRGERYILELLKDQGLQVLGTNGCEVLVDGFRQKISKKKATVKRWFEIAEAAAQLHLTIDFKLEAGRMESLQDRVRHLERLRNFLHKYPQAGHCFIPDVWIRPLPPTATEPKNRHNTLPDRQKLLAVTRLFLGEYLPAQQALWLPANSSDAISEAQESLSWGANAFGSTAALAYPSFLSGSRAPDHFKASEFKAWIEETGRTPAPQ